MLLGGLQRLDTEVHGTDLDGNPFWGTRPRLRRQIFDSDEAPEVLWLVRAYLITLHAPDAGGTRVYTEYHGTNQQVDSINCRGPLAQVVRAADS